MKLDGSELYALNGACALTQVTITVRDSTGAVSTNAITNITAVDPTGASVSFDFAFPAGNAKWQVQVKAGSNTSTIVEITNP